MQKDVDEIRQENLVLQEFADRHLKIAKLNRILSMLTLFALRVFPLSYWCQELSHSFYSSQMEFPANFNYCILLEWELSHEYRESRWNYIQIEKELICQFQFAVTTNTGRLKFILWGPPCHKINAQVCFASVMNANPKVWVLSKDCQNHTTGNPMLETDLLESSLR